MKVDMVEIKSKDELKELFADCQPIVEENLEVNGGTLKQSNLIDGDYKWSYLALLKREETCLGFALIRFSDYDQHKTSFDQYYYISQIAISKDFQGMGLGSLLLNHILENANNLPVVASVHKSNTASMNLFKKNMIAFSEKGNYVRFMGKNSYELINNDSIGKKIN